MCGVELTSGGTSMFDDSKSMMRRMSALAGVALMTGFHANAAAQEQPAPAEPAAAESWGDEGGFEFDTQEAQPVGDATPVARLMDEGLKRLAREDFAGAAASFWSVLQDPDISADAIRPRAQFEMGKALMKLKMYEGATVFFEEIVRAGPVHPYFEATAPWMMLLSRRVPGDPAMLSRISAFGSLFPDRIDAKYRDEMAFLLGQYAFNQGELESALSYFALVSPDSTFWARSLYYKGITYVRQYDAQPAVDAFKALLALDGKGAEAAEGKRLNEMAMLAMARTFYSTGEFEKSLRLFEGIPLGSSTWLDALFESSWAHFQLEQSNRALGNLHSLNSPFFSAQYYPEAPILQAVILFESCRYTGVRKTLDLFDDVYAPLLQQLEALATERTSDLDYFAFYEASESQLAADFDPRLQQITRAALSDRSVREAEAFVRQVESERAALSKLPAEVVAGPFGQYLGGKLDGELGLAQTNLGGLVRRRMERITGELRTKRREAEAIRVEVDLSEASLLKAQKAMGAVGEVPDVVSETRPEWYQMAWPFEKEYWRDELGHYSYHIASKCR
ncbi:MAG: hypothetical protein HQ461_05435 [Deltaproteobacteria bacterium]|nr:hypothetical protein [Deltaproteobacteria bacterium]